LADDLKLNQSSLRLVNLFLNDPSQKWSGAEITKIIGMGTGTLYPLLARFEAAGWLTGEWEKIDPSEEGRPRRRYYRMTALGARRSRAALADLQFGAFAGRAAWST